MKLFKAIRSNRHEVLHLLRLCKPRRWSQDELYDQFVHKSQVNYNFLSVFWLLLKVIITPWLSQSTQAGHLLPNYGIFPVGVALRDGDNEFYKSCGLVNELTTLYCLGGTQGIARLTSSGRWEVTTKFSVLDLFLFKKINYKRYWGFDSSIRMDLNYC